MAKTSSRRPAGRHLVMCASAVTVLHLSLAAGAATVQKADNADNLNLGSSWVGGVVPGLADQATWDATVTAGNTTAALGANLSWAGIKVTDPAGPVTISAGSALTLGTQGIDLSSSTQDLTINSGLTIARGKQTWNVAAGRTLTVAAIPTKATNTAGVVQFGTAGTIKLGAAASSLVTDTQNNAWGTFGANDWAALDSTGNVIAASYTAATTTITHGIINDIQGDIGVIGSTSLISALRFNSTTAYNVNVANSGTTRTATVGGILVTADSAGGSVGGNGRTNAFIRPNRSSGGAQHAFNVIQNSASDFTIGAVISNGSASTAILAKSGSGKLILTGNNGYTAGTVINEGTVQVGAAGTTGALGAGGVTNNGALVYNRSDALTEANVISGSGTLTQAGAGTLTLSGANTYTGATTISGGVLQLGVSNAIADASDLSLEGGTFDANGKSDALGAIALAGPATLQFGAAADTGNLLTFASASYTSGSLNVTNWDGSAGGGGADQFLVTGSIDPAFLGSVSFIDPVGFAPGTYAATTVDNEIVPVTAVPEPGAFAIVIAGGCAMLGRRRRMIDTLPA